MAHVVLRAFDLRHDQEDPAVIAASVRAGVAAVGTNLWVLIFAIMVASIGLNVNSTAVIIGAMLISPLMGPIVGIGFGAATNDFPLIREAARNLALMVGISLATATLYFALTPLGEAHSELLARTQPTLWDVLIAFFGGAAGIVAITRRGFSNAVPGVAIATALMPPLCTAGYGLAMRDLDFLGGALFLFLINSVFIALATLLFAKLMRLPARAQVDPAKRRMHAAVIWAVVVAVIVPSAYLGAGLVARERFAMAVQRAVAEVASDERVLVLARDVQARRFAVDVTVAGVEPGPVRDRLRALLAAQGFGQAAVRVRAAGPGPTDLSALRQELARDLGAVATAQLDQATARLHALEERARTTRDERDARARLLDELVAQFPEAESVEVAEGERRAPGATPLPLLVVRINGARVPAAVEAARLERGWAARFPGREVELLQGDAPP